MLISASEDYGVVATSDTQNWKEKMDKYWAHTAETSVNHQTSFDIEPSREEKRPAEEHLATGSPGRHEETGIQK